jgi:hypothetical protein
VTAQANTRKRGESPRGVLGCSDQTRATTQSRPDPVGCQHGGVQHIAGGEDEGVGKGQRPMSSAQARGVSRDLPCQGLDPHPERRDGLVDDRDCRGAPASRPHQDFGVRTAGKTRESVRRALSASIAAR